jgi:hypothetical protein
MLVLVNLGSCGGTREHGIRLYGRQPGDLFLWVHELQLNKICHNTYQLHGYFIFSGAVWRVHLRHLYDKIQGLCLVWMRGVYGMSK